tara:strand:- start:259 stop:702 length:444 start_codon:yes stop_codon:yes gene_type:complete
MINEDPFKDVKQVAVIGGKIDTNGLTSQSVKVCKVLQVGEVDIMIEDTSSYSSTVVIVPKSICVPIVAKATQLRNSRVSKPQLGDLIYTVQRVDWKDKKPTKTVGILYEVKYELGQPATLTILVGDEFRTVKNENILVLQTVKNKIK